MKIERIGSNKNVDAEADIIQISHDGIKYTISPNPWGGVRIHRNDGENLTMHPACRNEIIIT